MNAAYKLIMNHFKDYPINFSSDNYLFHCLLFRGLMNGKQIIIAIEICYKITLINIFEFI